MLPEHPESPRPSREKISPRSLGDHDLEDAVVSAIRNVTMDSVRRHLAAIELASVEFRDQHRYVYGPFAFTNFTNSNRKPRLTVSIERSVNLASG